MIRLVGAELARLRARRMTLLTALLLLVGLGLFQLVVNTQVTPPSAAAVAQNEQYYQDAVKEWEANHVQQEKDCTDSGQSAADCAYPKPTPADYALEATPFAEVAEVAVQFATYATLLASYLLAASAIGAEYGTGAIANWLTFVPQRLKVLGSKLVAIALTTAAGGVVALAFTIGAAALLTRIHGGTVDKVAHLSATAGRGAVLVVVVALLGFCLALLTRHTVAALGIVLAALVGTYVLLALSSSQPRFAALIPYLPSTNLAGFLQHGTTYGVPVITVTAQGSSFDYVERTLSFAHASTYWAVILVVVLAAAAVVFRRRDVT